MIPLLEQITGLASAHVNMVSVIIIAHVVIIGLALCVGLSQDTTPDWLKARKDKLK
jgi:hypothetical protein